MGTQVLAQHCINIVAPTGPPSSSNITITNQCLTHLTISWTSKFDDYTTCGPISYNITLLHHNNIIQMTTVNSTSYYLAGLLPSTTYTIKLYSIDSAGYSVSSSNVSTAGCKCICICSDCLNCSTNHYSQERFTAELFTLHTNRLHKYDLGLCILKSKTGFIDSPIFLPYIKPDCVVIYSIMPYC